MTWIIASLLTLAAPHADGGPDQPAVLVVVGTPGTPDYDLAFRTWADHWRDAAARAGADFLAIGIDKSDAAPPDRNRLRDWLAGRGKSRPAAPLWLVLIGHGSFDGRDAKFNLRGPDCTADELAAWLRPITGPVAALDCTSASGPFLAKLAAPNRVVVTATKSGAEQNYARLGQYLAEAWADPHADLDKDGQTSLLEAFVLAGKRTAEFYKSKARLSTEHALIDDNADGRGTPADWFEGIRLARKPQSGTPRRPEGQPVPPHPEPARPRNPAEHPPPPRRTRGTGRRPAGPQEGPGRGRLLPPARSPDDRPRPDLHPFPDAEGGATLSGFREFPE